MSSSSRRRPPMMIEDTTMTALHAALSGLAQRQRVTADNIANVNTPGFLAGRTDFEIGAARASSRNGETPTISGGTVARSLEPTNTNGNNVNLDEETVIADRDRPALPAGPQRAGRQVQRLPHGAAGRVR